MSYLYSLYAYYIWGEDTTVKKQQLSISCDELKAKITLITKNNGPPHVIEGYGKIKEKKIEVVVVRKRLSKVNHMLRMSKHDELLKNIRGFEFKKMRKNTAPDKSWTKINETSKERQKTTLAEIAKIKKNLARVKYRRDSFQQEWEKMTKWDKKTWHLKKRPS